MIILIMTLMGNSKVYKHPKANTLYISIPANMASDSAFPFKEGDTINLSVENDCLYVFRKMGDKEEKA